MAAGGVDLDEVLFLNVDKVVDRLKAGIGKLYSCISTIGCPKGIEVRDFPLQYPCSSILFTFLNYLLEEYDSRNWPRVQWVDRIFESHVVFEDTLHSHVKNETKSSNCSPPSNLSFPL